MEFPIKVLVVEDEFLIAAVLEETLSDAGYLVRTCSDGDAAFVALEERGARFRVIVTDIRMPGRDGWCVARRARELASDIGVVYVTGDSHAHWAARGVPGSILITKPYHSEQIIAAVSSLLNKT